MTINKLGACALSLLFAVAFVVACGASAAAQDAGSMGGMNAPRVDRRKMTTVQSAAADYGKTKDAVEVRYLNLPWGETTFGYIETGVDPSNKGYYAGRTWPIAHLRLRVPATWQGKALAPGDYALVITPRDAKTKTDMTLAISSFKPAAENGTFIKAGDVFVETPKDARVVSKKTIKFAKGAPKMDELHMAVVRRGKNVDISIHYGDRALTETLKLK